MPEVAGERPQVGPALYGGLFFVTLSTLMYEVLLTRIFSVTMGYHFAFVAVSVALFGMTAGALLVYLLPARFPEARTHDRLWQAAALFSGTMVVSFLTQLTIPFTPEWSFLAVYSAAVTYLIIAVPFTFSGVAVCLALTRFPQQVSRLYGVDLLGAGLGTITLIWLLDVLQDGPSAVLAVAGLTAVGACCFASAAGRTPHVVLLGALAALLVVFATGNALALQEGHPILRIRWLQAQLQGRAQFETWNAFSQISVIGDPNTPQKPLGWGMSSRYDGGPVRQLSLVIDGKAGSPLTRYDGDRAAVQFLKFDVTNLVHYLRTDADVLVIGSGGGRDVLSALLFGQRSVTAVELNGAIMEIVNGRYGDFTGHLDRQPGVTFVQDEARSYLARSDEEYDIIQISLIDTWAATAAGAFALSENSLYTTEAWESFLDHLTDRGVLSVSRWHARAGTFGSNGPLESYRLTALATQVLRRAGVEQPRQHLMLVRSQDTAQWPSVATLLVSRAPFSSQDVFAVAQAANRLDFEVVLAPTGGTDPLFAQIVEADDPNTVDLGFPADISPPTDNRPFFFQMLRYQDLFNPDLYRGFNEHLTRPVLVLFSLSIAVVGLTLLCLVVPVALTANRKAVLGLWPLVVFFSGIGLGFLLLEIAQMQRLILFLGHPTYALSVVLFSLLVASGIGSFTTERLVNPHLRPSLAAPLVVLLIVLVFFGLLTPLAIDQFEAATTPVRILIAVGILTPMGLVMGVPFPLGMKVAALREDAPTPFFWGINGATSVCASVLAVTLAIGWGISVAFWVGCACYALATAALGLVAARGRL